jgi:hypothetical protein
VPEPTPEPEDCTLYQQAAQLIELSMVVNHVAGSPQRCQVIGMKINIGPHFNRMATTGPWNSELGSSGAALHVHVGRLRNGL